METILFATGNKGKIEEATPLFKEEGLELEQVDVDVPEIDAIDVGEVAEQKVRDSFNKAVEQGLIKGDEMMIVDDTGFYVEGLDGFPGASAAFFAKTAGVEKLLPMMDGEKERSAYFKTAVAVYFPEEDRVKTFNGKMKGKVPEEKKGEPHPHLPYSSYFIPDETEGELSLAEDRENQGTHRKKAVESFLERMNSP